MCIESTERTESEFNNSTRCTESHEQATVCENTESNESKSATEGSSTSRTEMGYQANNISSPGISRKQKHNSNEGVQPHSYFGSHLKHTATVPIRRDCYGLTKSQTPVEALQQTASATYPTTTSRTKLLVHPQRCFHRTNTAPIPSQGFVSWRNVPFQPGVTAPSSRAVTYLCHKTVAQSIAAKIGRETRYKQQLSMEITSWRSQPQSVELIDSEELESMPDEHFPNRMKVSPLSAVPHKSLSVQS